MIFIIAILAIISLFGLIGIATLALDAATLRREGSRHRFAKIMVRALFFNAVLTFCLQVTVLLLLMYIVYFDN